MKLLDILATGGTNFNVRLIPDYDASQSAAVQEGESLGSLEFGEIDGDGQYVGDDDEIIEAARAEYDIDESVTASVR